REATTAPYGRWSSRGGRGSVRLGSLLRHVELAPLRVTVICREQGEGLHPPPVEWVLRVRAVADSLAFPRHLHSQHVAFASMRVWRFSAAPALGGAARRAGET